MAAYRELSARRIFWLALAVTLLVVGVFGSLGINERGVSLLWWEFSSPFFNTNTVSPETFYKLLFMNFGVEWWLGMLATILALLTTCGIIPDLVAPGSIDLLLARPISRTRLFLTKYATGLLFSALQVFVFSAATFLVIGIRGGSWEWTLFLAVPIMTFVYSLLFSICALVGIITRSSVASLILTMIAWAVISTVALGESLTGRGLLSNTLQIEACEKGLADEETSEDEDRKLELEEHLAEALEERPSWERVHWWFHAIYLCLPKTGESIDALNRSIVPDGAMPWRRDREPDGPGQIFAPQEVDRREFEKIARASETRPFWWIILTSSLFEATVLGLATYLFVRRDY